MKNYIKRYIICIYKHDKGLTSQGLIDELTIVLTL